MTWLNEDETMNMYRHKICEYVCKVLCEGTSDKKITEDFVDLLSSLFRSSQTRLTITKEMATTIKMSLERFIDNEYICLKLLRSISKGLNEDEGILKTIFNYCFLYIALGNLYREAGLIETVVKAINTHINNADVCEMGCAALWNMTAKNCK